MRHLKKGRKLHRTADERKSMLKNLAISLILHSKIKTTEARAKSLRPFVERLINRAKVDALVNRRYLMRFLTKEAVNMVFEISKSRYQKRNGGYTRITKIGQRYGDSAEIAQIELV